LIAEGNHLKLFIYIIFFSTFTIAAQEQDTLSEEEYRTIRSDIMDNYAKDPVKAVMRIEKYYQEYRFKLSNRQHLRLMYTKAFFQINAEQFEDAHATLILCKQLADELNNPNLTYYYHSYMADMLNILESYQLAMPAYLSALDVAKQTSDQAMIARAYNNVGHALITIGRYEQAKPYIDYFYQYGVSTSNSSYISTALNNYGELELGKQNLDAAKEYFTESLNMRLKNQNEIRSSWSYHYLGKVHYLMQDYQLAEQYLNKAIIIRVKYKRELEAARSSLFLINVYFSLEQYDNAYHLLMQTINTLEKKKNLQLTAQAYDLLFSYFKKMKNYQRAVEISDKLHQVNKSFFARKSNIALSHYLAKLEVNTKELENIALKKENELTQEKVVLKQQQLYSILALSVVFIVMTFAFIKSLSSKNKKLKSTIAMLDKTKLELIEAEKISAMATLVSGMAHQLNTPIGIIITANSVIQDKLLDIKDRLEKQTLKQSFLKKTLTEVEQTLNLTEISSQKTAGLIDQFKHISTELGDAEISQTRLKSFIDVKLKLISSQYKNIAYYEVIGDDIHIKNYLHVLFKVLEQLVKNSSESLTEIEQSLTLRVIVKKNANSLNIVYSDNGHGITEETRRRVFEPFFTTKGMQGSMGLGLNVAYNSVVHLMQGKLTCVQSAHGAKFIIELPFTIEP
jgi:signal transduction histidine kinase